MVKWSSVLNKKKKKNNKKILVSPTNEKPRCKICNLEFRYPYQALRHWVKEHSNPQKKKR